MWRSWGNWLASAPVFVSKEKQQLTSALTRARGKPRNCNRITADLDLEP